MKGLWLFILAAASCLTLAAADTPWTFGEGQVFISVYAGFIQTADNPKMDTVYDLCFHSAISRYFSLGFSYMQRQSQFENRSDTLVVPLEPAAGMPAQDMLANVYISSKLYTLEGEYHFTRINVNRLDLFAGAGFGLEINKTNTIHYTLAAAGKPEDAQLRIDNEYKSSYYPTAHFFGGLRFYLAETLALAGRAGYQYSGTSGYSGFLGLGITFRIK